MNSKMFEIKNYLINVDNRIDRLANVSHRFDLIRKSFYRISAVRGEELVDNFTLFTMPNMEANWRSLQKVFKIIAESEEEFAFVFEDDVIFQKDIEKFFTTMGNFPSLEFDVIQFGFCLFSGRNDDKVKNSHRKIVRRIFDMYLKSTNKLRKIHLYHAKSELRQSIYEKNTHRFNLEKVLGLRLENSCEPGTHAFAISKKFASKLINYNLPMLMSGDLLFMTLSKCPQYKMFRLENSLAFQDTTFPSVGRHAPYTMNLSKIIMGDSGASDQKQ
jgi:GR25 family glycosyltransferase involved in LPS biosynthesis